jgi:hypothetical protein
VLGGTAAAVLAVLVAVPILALAGGDDSQDLATDGGATTTRPDATTTTDDPATTTTTSPPTTTTPPTTAPTTSTTTTTAPEPEPERPAVAVAVTVDNRLVVVDTASGAIVRTLHQEAEHEDGTGRIVSPALSSDGTSVVFSVRQPGCDDRIYRVGIDGGAVELLAEGSAGALSPDGRRLAYAALRPNPEIEGWCITVLTVRDLVTGEERSWPPEANGWDDITGVGQISWAPDSRRFAYDQFFENSGTLMLDTAAGTTLREAASAVGSGDVERATPAWMTGDRIAVVTYCCYADEDPNQTGIDLVLAGGRGAGDRLARPEHVPRDLAADVSGRFLVYVQGRGEVAVDGPEDLIDPGGALVLLDLDGTTTTLSGSYLEVDW